jgi:hypothetical protein
VANRIRRAQSGAMQNKSVKSLIPTDALKFTDEENELFEELYEDAEIEAIVEALFPDALLKP